MTTGILRPYARSHFGTGHFFVFGKRRGFGSKFSISATWEGIDTIIKYVSSSLTVVLVSMVQYSAYYGMYLFLGFPKGVQRVV